MYPPKHEIAEALLLARLVFIFFPILLAVSACQYVMRDSNSAPPGQGAKIVAVWKCSDFVNPIDKTTIVTLTQFDDGYGTVQAAGKTTYTVFSIEGLDRRWDWEWDNVNGYRYSILLNPNGAAIYYDFVDASGSAKPKQFFKCKS